MLETNNFEQVVSWVRNGSVDFNSEEEARSYVRWLLADETAFEVAIEMMERGRVFDRTAEIVLWQVVNTV